MRPALISVLEGSVEREALGVGGKQSVGCCLFQGRGGRVLRRQDRLDLPWPGESQVGVQRVDAVLTFRRISGGAQIGDNGIIGQRHERVAETFRDVDSAAVDVVESDRVEAAEGWGPDPDVDHDVEDRPSRAVDVFRLARRDIGEVNAANGSPPRHRLVGLCDVQRMPDDAFQDVGSEPFQEDASLVGELARGEHPGVRNRERSDVHGPEPIQEVSRARADPQARPPGDHSSASTSLAEGQLTLGATCARHTNMSRRLLDLGDFDVIVVGSGSAGSTAAIAAARQGASTLLVEKLPFLGGVSTAVLDTFYGFYTPGEAPRKVVGGIADEVVARLRGMGSVLERPNTYGAGTGITYLAEHLKIVWETLVTSAGARVLLHAMLQDVEVVDGTVTGVVVATKGGLGVARCRIAIDASGDADLCHFAGFGYELAGRDSPAQTLTTTFRMANVDIEERKLLTRDQLHQLMREAADSGSYDLPRRDGSDHITPIPGVMATVMTRIKGVQERDGTIVNATDPWLLTEAEIAGRRQVLEYVRFLKDKVPGYAKAELVGMSAQIGLRETRRVYGEYWLTAEDVLTAQQFDDQIALSGAPIEDHHSGEGTRWKYLPTGEAVGIPLRCLLVKDAGNVLVAGRCFSAAHDAHAAVRSMAQCMAMGQAAGTLAGIATRRSCDIRDVPFAMLGEQLRRDGAVLTSERTLIPR